MTSPPPSYLQPPPPLVYTPHPFISSILADEGRAPVCRSAAALIELLVEDTTTIDDFNHLFYKAKLFVLTRDLSFKECSYMCDANSPAEILAALNELSDLRMAFEEQTRKVVLEKELSLLEAFMLDNGLSVADFEEWRDARKEETCSGSPDLDMVPENSTFVGENDGDGMGSPKMFESENFDSDSPDSLPESGDGVCGDEESVPLIPVAEEDVSSVFFEAVGTPQTLNLDFSDFDPPENTGISVNLVGISNDPGGFLAVNNSVSGHEDSAIEFVDSVVCNVDLNQKCINCGVVCNSHVVSSENGFHVCKRTRNSFESDLVDFGPLVRKRARIVTGLSLEFMGCVTPTFDAGFNQTFGAFTIELNCSKPDFNLGCGSVEHGLGCFNSEVNMAEFGVLGTPSLVNSVGSRQLNFGVAADFGSTNGMATVSNDVTLSWDHFNLGPVDDDGSALDFACTASTSSPEKAIDVLDCIDWQPGDELCDSASCKDIDGDIFLEFVVSQGLTIDAFEAPVISVGASLPLDSGTDNGGAVKWRPLGRSVETNTDLEGYVFNEILGDDTLAGTVLLVPPSLRLGQSGLLSIANVMVEWSSPSMLLYHSDWKRGFKIFDAGFSSWGLDWSTPVFMDRASISNYVATSNQGKTWEDQSRLWGGMKIEPDIGDCIRVGATCEGSFNLFDGGAWRFCPTANHLVPAVSTAFCKSAVNNWTILRLVPVFIFNEWIDPSFVGKFIIAVKLAEPPDLEVVKTKSAKVLTTATGWYKSAVTTGFEVGLAPGQDTMWAALGGSWLWKQSNIAAVQKFWDCVYWFPPATTYLLQNCNAASLELIFAQKQQTGDWVHIAADLLLKGRPSDGGTAVVSAAKTFIFLLIAFQPIGIGDRVSAAVAAVFGYKYTEGLVKIDASIVYTCGELGMTHTATIFWSEHTTAVYFVWVLPLVWALIVKLQIDRAAALLQIADKKRRLMVQLSFELVMATTDSAWLQHDLRQADYFDTAADESSPLVLYNYKERPPDYLGF